jgi:hypothetical protein
MYITKYNNLLPKMQEYNQILLLLSTSKSINTMDFYILLLNRNLAMLCSQQLLNHQEINYPMVYISHAENITNFYGTIHHPYKVLLLHKINTKDGNITNFFYDVMTKYNKLLSNQGV